VGTHCGRRLPYLASLQRTWTTKAHKHWINTDNQLRLGPFFADGLPLH